MSWMKRRGQSSPNPANPGIRMYNPNQHSNQQQQWQQPPVQQQYNPNNWFNQPKPAEKTPPPAQSYGQQGTPSYWQQPSYPQQPNYNAANQMMPNQYEQYNQHQQNYYQNQGYGHTEAYQQPEYAQTAQPNYYPNQQQSLQAQQPISNMPITHAKETTSEADPWNWGWEDNNSNQQPANQNKQNVTESFANDESWNWTVDDSSANQNVQKTEKVGTNSQPDNSISENIESRPVENHDYPPIEHAIPDQSPDFNRTDNIAHHITNTVEQLPHATVSRLAKSENLTPQWSIESQVSQDSSDDILLTSESDNRSNILSRSSTVSHSPSRPASTHDNIADYNTNPYKYDNDLVHKPNENEPSGSTSRVTFEEPNSEIYRENIIESIDKPMQELSLNAQFENKEIVTPEVLQSKQEVQQPIKEPTPPPPRAMAMNNQILPPPTQAKEDIKHPIKEPTPPPPRNNPLLPPPAQSSDANKNPYKRNTVLSHSAANKLRTPIESSSNSDAILQTMYLPNNQQPIRHENLGVNLETLPDNSERPDQLPVEPLQKTVRKTSTVQQQWIAENCEIAPINDRNQYLETGQLSDADVPVYNQSGGSYEPENTQGTSTDNGDSLPPPGLRRLVLGQLEQSEVNQSVDNADEPPPGLSRMVLGRTESEPPNLNQDMFNTNLSEFSSNVEEPPVGLHRMVPGESSSPESSSYPRYQGEPNVYQPSHFDDDNYVSETELNQLGISVVSQRSATIGADTPPATNPQTTTAGYSSSSSGEPIISRVGAVGIDSEHRDTDVDGANTLDESNPSASSLPPDNNRRDNIDGGPQDDVIAVRNQTVGQNSTDIPSSNTSQQDKTRKSNRTYTTDSEHEQSKERLRSSSPNRYEKDRRYHDDRRDRYKDRESPDRYRDRKYDRRLPERRHDDKRYDEDTDYYSDRERTERRHKEEREEYDKRYSSLRRDKDRDKRRRDYDGRDDRRDDRRNDYYYRYDEDYYNREPNRSRPSSRSDSVHDSYRERSHRHERDLDRSVRHRDRDRDKDSRRARDPYNQYYQGYHNYDPYNPYYQQYQQYQYYENLRRTNPQAYAEWYRKYYQSQTATAGYNAEDRASVHSGRSSANGDMSKDRMMDHTDSSLNLEDTTVVSQRLTPAKFSTAHVKASISSGYLLNILPHYPLDGQPATIEVINIHSLLQDDEETKELKEFPGPLIRGVTHKKTVIEYCENKIKKASPSIQDVESYILMWELLILLLRQNGMVVGTDIAELLMKNRTTEDSRSHSVSSASSMHIDSVVDQIEPNRASPSSVHQFKDDYITDKFREYLIYGSGKEALEWAMKHGLWGHALFLASKLDKRTYANVMMRFANGLTMNDPLQTLYQLLSGRQPAAVTCVADEKWGDWRPHLAMILSNTTQRPELDRKAITTLGDTLFSRGSIYAAQFCYLMAQVEFGRYGTQNTKIVLLGSSHLKPFRAFASNEAIFMTEVYEYACSLSDASFAIPEFLSFKYLLSTRLVDHGLLEKGLQYLERTADGITQNPTRVQSSLVSKVCELSDRLKYYDPLQAEDLDSNRADATWLTNLKSILNDFNMGLISHQSLRNLSSSDAELSQDIKPVSSNEQQQMHEQQQWQQQQIENYYQPTEQQNIDYSQQQQSTYQDIEPVQKQENDVLYDQQAYWNQQQQQQQQQQTWEDSSAPQLITEDQPHNNYWNNQQVEDQPQPQITMPNQSQKMYEDVEEKDDTISKPVIASKPKPAPTQAKPASTGWFGGIWNKLSLRPKNQMKLPDDKNPTIVWDSEKKRWVNLEADGEEVNTELKPPPKMSDMYRSMPTANQTSFQSNVNSGSMSLPPSEPTPMVPTAMPTAMSTAMPTAMPAAMSSGIPHSTPAIENKEPGDGPKQPPQPNMFKLRRGRNIKNAYVDVFNPGGVKPSTDNVPSAEEVFGAIPSVGTQMNYFVPAPVADPNAPADFLTPALVSTEDNTQVQGGPMMYNPNEYSNAARGKNH